MIIDVNVMTDTLVTELFVTMSTNVLPKLMTVTRMLIVLIFQALSHALAQRVSGVLVAVALISTNVVTPTGMIVLVMPSVPIHKDPTSAHVLMEWAVLVLKTIHAQVNFLAVPHLVSRVTYKMVHAMSLKTVSVVLHATLMMISSQLATESNSICRSLVPVIELKAHEQFVHGH